MRKNKVKILYVISFLLLIFAWSNVSAQCGNCTSDGPLNTLSYARPAYAPEWTTVQSNSVEGRDYMLFNVVKGEIYRWTTYGTEDESIGLDQSCIDDDDCVTGLTCEGLVGSKTCELGFDTQLTLLKGTCSESGEVLAYNRNGLFRNQSVIEWKADFNGTVFLLVTNYECMTSCDLDGLNCMTTTVKWQRKDSAHCSECTYTYPTTVDPPETPASSFVNPVDSPGWTLTADNDIKAGEFQTFAVDKGKIYRWSTCSDESFDTQLTLYRGIASVGECGMFLEYSDDSPNTGTCLNGTKQTVLTWQSDFTGYVTVLLNQYNCATCGKSQNPTDPYGHCAVSSLEWQRYDCNECMDYVSTETPDTSLDTKNNLDHGDYMKFNLVKGGQYVFRSIAEDTSTSFTGLLTLRKSAGSACYGEVLKQSEKVTGSHVQQIVFTPLEDMTAELLVSGPDCNIPTGKHANITYQMIYDPDDRFDVYEDGNGDTWTGTVFDGETQTVYLDKNVSEENWTDALLYCENLVYNIPGGGTVDGWSLPNINQLYAVVDFNLFDPATSADWVSYITDTSGEGGACTQPTQETDCTYPKYICSEDQVCARNNWYWSATTVYGTEEFAWGVNMKDGRSYRALKYDYDGTNSTAYRVICVTGVSVFGELDALRPAEERIFSGWACDKKDVNDRVKIYFEIFYSKDPINNPGSVESVLNMMNYLNPSWKGDKIGWWHYGWEYGKTDLFPDVGSPKEFKVNSNCGNTAQTTEHAYELDFNDTSNSIVQKMRAAIASDSKHKPPYYVTAWAEELGMGGDEKELTPQKEIFVINDVCGDNHITGSEMCDDGNTDTEECAYNTSCIVCDSSCQLVAGYSPHCGDSTIDAPDENCDCGPGYWTVEPAPVGCSESLGSKRCPGYGTGTESCTICNEICNEEILTVPHCGDGYTDTLHEACDDGDASNNNACLTNCQLNVCGDGYIFNVGVGADEICDDGANNGAYENQCVPGPCCNTTCDGDGPHCGDGMIQRSDDCSGYSPCEPGIVGANEICDQGTDNGKWLTLAEHNVDAGCSSSCDDIAPYCGDSILQSTYEVCDDGGANQDGVYGKCQTDCQAKPRCGDGRLDGPGGDGLTTGPEICDDGANNGAYGYCNDTCTGLVKCGDAIVQLTHEECDLGTGNFTDYAIDKDFSCCYANVGDCVGNCVVGRYCGDAFIDSGRDDSVASDLYYRFDEKSGAVVNDYSGNGQHGVAANVTRCKGKYSRGVFVDDSSDPTLERVTGPAVAATTDLTLEAWVFPTEYTTEYATVILGNPGYYLSVYKDGSLRAYWYDKVPEGYHSTAAGLVPLRTWTHLAAVWSSTELKLYINGILKNTISVTGTGRAATSTIIGAQSLSRQFRGIIDEVIISARVLTADEIMTHVTGKAGNEWCDNGDADHGNGNIPVGSAILDYETICSDACGYFHFCGDGKIDGPGGDGLTSGPEVCDDGIPGNYGEYGRCNPGCLELGPHCGDGEKNGPEECDDGTAGNTENPGTVGVTCRTDCTLARCGDGIQDSGEECDDGALNSDTAPGACRTTCEVSRCGDMVKDPTEECDDGNAIDYDSCTSLCLNPECGDGIQKTIDSTTGEFSWYPNEACDDGNQNNNDYCRYDCMAITGYCGDGLIQTGAPASEACDNATTGDGIGAYCTGPCTGSGASMTCDVGCTYNHGSCGDGDIDYIAGEICDDGNAVNGDYCSYPACTITGSCGDGTIQINEICDSADPSVGAGQGIGGYCINNCQTNLGYCGDGKIQGVGYTEAMYGGTLPAGPGWTFSGPELCDTSDPRVVSLGDETNIGCDSDCQRSGTCGDGIRQKRFEGCDVAESLSSVLELEMDESAGTIASDSSGNGYDFTVYNGAVWTTGRFGRALSFDGVDDYAKINTDIVGSPSSLTIAAWVKKDGDGSNYECAIHSSSNATIGATEYWLGFNDGDYITATIGARVSGIGWNAGMTTIQAVTGRWYHIAATWNGSVVKVYVDGSLQKQYPLTSYSSLATPTRIGASSDGANYQLNGTVDSVKIYDYALTNEQVLALMEDLHLRMDENSGTVAHDTSLHGYEANLYNGATWSTGQYGSALKFDGVNDYARINDNIVVNPTELTMAAWIRRDGNGSTYECAIHKGSDTSIGNSEYWLGVDINNYLTATIGARTGVGWAAGQTSTVAAVGTWYHLAAVWDGSVVKVYLNGIYNKQYALTSYSNLTTPVRLGASSDGAHYQFNGSVDDVRFIQKALSATEVAEIMSGGTINCHSGCMSDPKGHLDVADRSVIKGWACDPDHPMDQNDVRLVFTDANSNLVDTKVFATSYSSELDIQKICGGGANHRWQFDPNDGSIDWGFHPPNPPVYTQPFTVRAYSVTPDGSPESDVFIGSGTFSLQQICGDGVLQRIDCTGFTNCDEVDTVSSDEECDDGNGDNTDNCRIDCQLPSCGDGVVSGNATGGYYELCEQGQTTSCVSAGVPDGNGTVQCQTDCKSWVTAPNICTKTWTCPAKPQTHTATETAWNTVSTYNQIWDGSQWVPADSDTVYSAVGSSTECRYNCGTNFEYDFGIVNWKDPAAWDHPAQVSWDPDVDALKFSGYAWNLLNTFIPIDTTQEYYLEYDVMVESGDGSRTYGGTRSYDSSYATLPGHPGTYDYFTDSGSIFTPGVWYHRNNTVIGGAPRTGESSTQSERDKWHTGTKYAKVLIIHGYNTGTAQNTYIKNLKFYPITGAQCVPATRTFVCNPKPGTGTVWNSPESYTQTWTWNGTSYQWDPAADSDTDYDTTYDSQSCRFKCADDYHWNSVSQACEYNFATWTCPAKPANSAWNAVDSYSQSWGGTDFDPPNDTNTDYNEVPSTTECRYRCAPGFFESSGNCSTTTCGDGNITVEGQDVNLKLHLAMNTNYGSTVYDSSGNNNHGTINGASWTSGQYYYGINFDGTNDYISVPSVNPTNEITVAAWVKSASSSGYGGVWQLVSKYNAFILGTSGTDNNNVCFIIHNGSAWQFGSCYAVPDPQNWHHFAGTYDSATGVKNLYVDGVLRGTATVSGTIAADTGSIHIAHRESSSVGSYHFGGIMDEVRIYDRALTEAEVVNSMEEYNFDSVTDSSEMLYMPMDEGSGSTAFDYSGKGNDGAIISPAWTAGKFQGGLEFNGSSGIDLGSFVPPTNNFTMMAWVNPDLTHEIDAQSTSGTAGTAGQVYVFYPDNHSADSGAGVSVGTNGVSVYEHGSSYMPAIAVYDGPISGWNHIAVTYTNRQPRIYINGVLQATGSTSPKTTVYGPTQIGFGYYGEFDGTLDQVRIFSRSLNVEEIKQAMGELCDETTAVNGTYNHCNATCDGLGPHCGDNITQTPQEECDWGDSYVPNGTYYPGAHCEQDCTWNSYCGDGDPNMISDGLKLYLRFDSNLNDSSASPANGTATVGASRTSAGKYSYGLNFNQSSNFQISDTAKLDITGPMSAAAWVKLPYDAANTRPYMIFGKGSGHQTNYTFWREADRDVSFVFHNWIVTGETCGARSSGPIDDGNWHHIAGTWDGTNIRMYVDGSLQETVACASSPQTNSDPITIGQVSPNVGYTDPYVTTGTIDEVRLYNRALSDQEVSSLVLYHEYCDAGAFNGCASTCDTDCTIKTADVCGNNSICFERGEVCDGSNFNGHNCNTEGWTSGSIACAGNCLSFDTSQCYTCGDGSVTGPEICDGTNLNGKNCSNVSVIPASTHNFGYTGGYQTFVVPSDITSVTLEVWGAQGGSGGCYSDCPTAGTGGKGGYSKGTLAVTPGETLYIYVGGAGAGWPSASTSMSSVTKAGGWNGGGNGYWGGGGGGGTDIRQGGTALGNRKIVAGGGGGAGNATSSTYLSNGGGGGGTSGQTIPPSQQAFGRTGGSGGTQTSGYALGVGQAASENLSGGGGGGYWGGTKGANSTSGGGGSGYTGGVSGGTMTTGTRTGNGYARITVPETSMFDGGTLACNSGCGSYDTSGCRKCGNGIIETGETCDDGNTSNSDGCSAVCQIESTHTCSGQPSTCLLKPGQCPLGSTCVNNSQFISQSVTNPMNKGQTYSVSVTFKNTGNTAWGASANYRLGTQNPGDNTLWTGSSRVMMGTEVIQPGQQKTFTFNVTAPSTSGTYNFQWKMLREAVEWFGAASTNVAVRVGSAACFAAMDGFNYGFASSEGWPTTSYWYISSGRLRSDADYNNWENTIQSPSHNLSACAGENVRIRFSAYNDMEEDYDYFYMDVYGGSTFQIPWAGWTEYTYNLPAGSKVNGFYIRYRVTTDGSVLYGPVYVDWVRLESY